MKYVNDPKELFANCAQARPKRVLLAVAVSIMIFLAMIGCRSNESSNGRMGSSNLTETISADESVTTRPNENQPFIENQVVPTEASLPATQDEPLSHEETFEGKCASKSVWGDPAFLKGNSEMLYIDGDNLIHRLAIESGASMNDSDYYDVWTFNENHRFMKMGASEWSDVIVVWSADEDFKGHLFLVDLETVTLTKVSEEKFTYVEGITVSPDGKWLGFNYGSPDSVRTPSQTQLRLINLHTNYQITLADETKSYTAPIWSPTGDRLVAYVQDSNNYGENEASQILLMDLTTEEITPISDVDKCATNVRWSPDGEQLAFLIEPVFGWPRDHAEIYIWSPDTSISTIVPELPFRFDSISAWLPDDSFILRQYDVTSQVDTFCRVSIDDGDTTCPWFTLHSDTGALWLNDGKVALIKFEVDDPYAPNSTISFSIEISEVQMLVDGQGE